MKSVSFYFLSFLLVVAILAPSVIVLVDTENKTELVIDFNEEEKKEEKKESKEKDFFSSFELDSLSDLNTDFSKTSSFYIEKNYCFSTSIFLPPPECTS